MNYSEVFSLIEDIFSTVLISSGISMGKITRKKTYYENLEYFAIKHQKRIIKKLKKGKTINKHKLYNILETENRKIC